MLGIQRLFSSSEPSASPAIPAPVDKFGGSRSSAPKSAGLRSGAQDIASAKILRTVISACRKNLSSPVLLSEGPNEGAFSYRHQLPRHCAAAGADCPDASSTKSPACVRTIEGIPEHDRHPATEPAEHPGQPQQRPASHLQADRRKTNSAQHAAEPGNHGCA